MFYYGSFVLRSLRLPVIFSDIITRVKSLMNVLVITATEWPVWTTAAILTLAMNVVEPFKCGGILVQHEECGQKAALDSDSSILMSLLIPGTKGCSVCRSLLKLCSYSQLSQHARVWTYSASKVMHPLNVCVWVHTIEHYFVWCTFTIILELVQIWVKHQSQRFKLYFHRGPMVYIWSYY